MEGFYPKAGEPIVVLEALGYICGTVANAGPLGICFEEDSIWIRNMGSMTDAVTTGRVEEFHHLPHCKLRDHAIRYTWDWNWPVPTKGTAKPRKVDDGPSSTSDSIYPNKGERVVVLEALGYICGTIAEAGPLGLKFEEDSVWIRNMGSMSDAVTSGKVEEFHPMPNCALRDHAIRYSWDWNWAIPSKGTAEGKKRKKKN